MPGNDYIMKALRNYIDEEYFQLSLPDCWIRQKNCEKDIFLENTYQYWAAAEIYEMLLGEDEDANLWDSLFEIKKMLTKFSKRAVGEYQVAMFTIAVQTCNDLLGFVTAIQ